MGLSLAVLFYISSQQQVIFKEFSEKRNLINTYSDIHVACYPTDNIYFNQLHPFTRQTEFSPPWPHCHFVTLRQITLCSAILCIYHHNLYSHMGYKQYYLPCPSVWVESTLWHCYRDMSTSYVLIAEHRHSGQVMCNLYVPDSLQWEETVWQSCTVSLCCQCTVCQSLQLSYF